jgi:hypothetical protein
MIKVIQTKATTLSYAISDSATSIRLANLLKLDGTAISASDIGDSLQGTFEPGTSKEEIFEIDGANVTVNSDGTVDITNVLRGRKEVEPYGSGGFATDHGPGAVVIFGNNPQLYNKTAIKANDNTFTGYNTFTRNPVKGDTSLAPSNDAYITKADLLAAVTGTVITDQVVVNGTAGENITTGQIVYFKEADQKWWKADADIVGTFDQVVLAVAQQTVSANASLNVLLQGMDKTQTGLTAGSKYYLSNTAGAISTTPGTTEVFLGWANTTVQFIFDPLGLYQPSSGQKAALAGSAGTPSSTNKYITQEDLTISKVADIQTFTTEATLITASDTSRFDITNTSGSTYRYTWDGTGTNPNITSSNPSTGDLIQIYSNAFNDANNGVFEVTASGTNYFEVTNSIGWAENDKVLGFGYVLQKQSGLTWTKPTNAKVIEVTCYGAGGGGGASFAGTTSTGGGGGACHIKKFLASDVGSTEKIMVGKAGAGVTVGTASLAGGASSFGTKLTAYGGGAGTGATNKSASGGGTLGQGRSYNDATANTGGLPSTSTTSPGLGGAAPVAANTEYGGAGANAGGPGYSSIYGGGAGAGQSSTTGDPGKQGGSNNSYRTGGGGTGGALLGGAGGNGARLCGGGSGGGNTAGNGGNGGNGGIGGGGGAGGVGSTGTSGNGGNGGRGEVIVVTYF